MSTLRLSIAGTVILALLGGLGSTVVAQDAEPTAAPDVQAPAAVEGVVTPVRHNHRGQVEAGQGAVVTTTSNYGWTLRVETNDPRLNGEYETNQNVHSYRSFVAVRSGIGRISNEGGSWTVEFHGFTPGDGNNHYMNYLTGEGGYEGLSAMLFMQSTPRGWDVEGVIAPDPMPEPPEWVLPPVE